MHLLDHCQSARVSVLLQAHPPIHKIVTMEDHPWVIVNRSCLSSGNVNKTSCRSSPCYTGFLVELLHAMYQYGGRNLDNCTIQEVSAFRSNQNSNGSFTKDDVMNIVSGEEADLALVPINASRGYKNIRKTYPVAMNIKMNDYYSLVFPYNSKLADSLNYTFHVVVT
ncbi:uncharacterized protein LOC118433042 isoform X2 [Folsomia candida]|uniref:uncharacterized protein LOC118433042 isoform X2 n=1 Tax=Folsomia candida TaxID=158441 RepID=UPI0016055439|nr:uncharacterized protein LOC118433042 isoform X2 [Folsomia candida]